MTMKAHFIGSTLDLKNDISSYRRIIDALKSCRVELTSEWLENAYRRSLNKKQETPGDTWQEIYRENIEAISKADVVIAEVGKKSFLVGFQVSMALQMKKPTLLLSKFERIDSALGVSLNEEIIRYSQYSDSTVEKVISDFIKVNSIDGKQIRFNFFINRKLLNYLNWASLKTGQTKAEIIRQTLKRDMENSDFMQ